MPQQARRIPARVRLPRPSQQRPRPDPSRGADQLVGQTVPQGRSPPPGPLRWLSRTPRRLVNRGDARYSGSVDRDELVRVLRAFEAAGLEYVLIGATAMGFHGLVRATEDVDLFIRA